MQYTAPTDPAHTAAATRRHRAVGDSRSVPLIGPTSVPFNLGTARKTSTYADGEGVGVGLSYNPLHMCRVSASLTASPTLRPSRHDCT